MKKNTLTPLCAALLALPFNDTLADEFSPLKWSGFATTGVTVSDNKADYMKPRFNNNPNFVGDSVLGLQGDYQVDKRVRGSVQMIARNVNDNFDVKAEWAYAAFQIDDSEQLRFGRLRIPAFLVSKYYYVGNSYLWARPIPEVYDILLFTGYSGTDLIKTFQFKSASFTLQPFVGQVDADATVSGQTAHLKSSRLFGLSLSFDTSNFSFRAMGGRAELTAQIPGLQFTGRTDAEFQSFGASYQLGNWEFVSEYSGTQVESALLNDDDSAYLTTAYHVGKWTPQVTFSNRRTATALLPKTAGADSDAVTLGLRYDYNSRLDFKTELRHGRAHKPATGLFQDIPERYTVNMFTFNIDLVF